jgi:hypothetical protein
MSDGSSRKLLCPCRIAPPEVARTAVDGQPGNRCQGRYRALHRAGSSLQSAERPNFVVLFGGRTVMQQAELVDHNQMGNSRSANLAVKPWPGSLTAGLGSYFLATSSFCSSFSILARDSP